MSVFVVEKKCENNHADSGSLKSWEFYNICQRKEKSTKNLTALNR